MSPVLCDYCEPSDHGVLSCPFRTYIDATCASVEKKINELNDKMIENLKVRIAEYSQCFNQSREICNEPDSSLGYTKPEVSFYDDFEPSYLSRPNLHNGMPLPSVKQEEDFPNSLSSDLAPHISSRDDITDDILVSAVPHTTLHDSCEFEVGEQFDTASELDLSITTDFKHHELDE